MKLSRTRGKNLKRAISSYKEESPRVKKK